MFNAKHLFALSCTKIPLGLCQKKKTRYKIWKQITLSQAPFSLSLVLYPQQARGDVTQEKVILLKVRLL